jgi:prolyl oligopeptidase
LRGGGEFGEAWHEAAKFEKKQNTFDDFIAAGEWLIANKYTNSSKLAIHGGSNGGLLVGACEVQRPDLFQAVICTYPLLDMIRFQKLLVGAFWVSEYGSADSANQIGYIKAYSPYHNVKQGVDYPYTLFITGDADTRVAPAHARKMTAMLQSLSAGKRPIMLDYDVEAGHSGGEALSKSIDSQARTLGFLFWTLNVQ